MLDDKEFWTAAYLACLAGGLESNVAVKRADNALKEWHKRWPT